MDYDENEQIKMKMKGIVFLISDHWGSHLSIPTNVIREPNKQLHSSQNISGREAKQLYCINKMPSWIVRQVQPSDKEAVDRCLHTSYSQLLQKDYALCT